MGERAGKWQRYQENGANGLVVRKKREMGTQGGQVNLYLLSNGAWGPSAWVISERAFKCIVARGECSVLLVKPQIITFRRFGSRPGIVRRFDWLALLYSPLFFALRLTCETGTMRARVCYDHPGT